MCRHKSGYAVRVDEATIRIYELERNDSHSEIIKAFKLDNISSFAKFGTPLECIPVRGIETIDQYDLVFDAGRPDWWTDGMSEYAKEVLIKASVRDLTSTGTWLVSLDLSAVTDLKGVKLPNVGGSLYLSAVTDLKGVKLPNVGGSLDLSAVTDLKGVKFGTVGGDLFYKGAWYKVKNGAIAK
jgi:hypothetical protein